MFFWGGGSLGLFSLCVCVTLNNNCVLSSSLPSIGSPVSKVSIYLCFYTLLNTTTIQENLIIQKNVLSNTPLDVFSMRNIFGILSSPGDL